MNPRFFLLFKRHLPEMVKIWDRKRRGCENEIARFRTESGYGEGEAGRNSPEEKLEGILGGLFKGSIVLGVGHDVGFEELNFVSNWIHLFKSIQTEESLYFLSTYILMELISTHLHRRRRTTFMIGLHLFRKRRKCFGQPGYC